MLGSSIAPFDFSGRAASSVRSRLVFCRAPGDCELKAGDIRPTASSLRGLRHCSRVRLGPGPRSFQRLRKENLAAPAQSSCRCAADGVGAKAGTLTHLGCVPWRGSAGKSAGKVAKARISSPSRMNLVAIIQQSVPCRDRLRFVRSKPRSARPPSPIWLTQIAFGGARGSLWNVGRPAAPPVCRSAPPQSQVARISAQKRGRDPLNPAPLTVEHTHQGGCQSARVFFRPHRRRCRHGADRFGLLRGPF
jgi:hypothetical protein